MPRILAAAVDYLLRYRILDVLLDRAAQITRTVGDGIALANKIIDKRSVPCHAYAALCNGIARFLEH